jgi:hypothetical protein
MNCKNTFINLCRTCHKKKLTNDRLRREKNARELGYKSEHNFKIENNENYVKYKNSDKLKLLRKNSDAIRNKSKINTVSDAYIIVLIKARGINVKDITPELIEIYRLNVKLKREINNARNE